jgi:hypothetical protein
MNRASKIRTDLALAFALMFSFVCMAGDVPINLKVLYVGNADSARAKEFRSFLSDKVARVGVTNRYRFDPALADEYDVVLLDWPQPDNNLKNQPPKKSPLGDLKRWTKPTVFLGSAGLQMAEVWDVKGGFG